MVWVLTVKPAGKPTIDEDDVVDAKRNPALARHMMSPGRTTGPLSFKDDPREVAAAAPVAAVVPPITSSTTSSSSTVSDEDVVRRHCVSDVCWCLLTRTAADEGHAFSESTEPALTVNELCH